MAATMTSTDCSVSLIATCIASAQAKLFKPSQSIYHKTGLNGGRLPMPVSESNFYRDAQLSVDGTTIVTSSADNHLRTYILPADLLENSDEVRNLSPYTEVVSVEPIYSRALYPFYSLDNAASTLMLSSPRDHPIGLRNVLDPNTPLLGSYRLQSLTTEKFITPHSLLWPQSLGGNKFVTGSESLICIFDVSRPGEEPLRRLPTIPSRRKQIVGGGVGMKGIISALGICPADDKVLAAGTFTRHVGLYSGSGEGECIGVFSVAGTAADEVIGGRGVTQVSWSPDGRYLFVAERKSDGVLMYDIRVTGKLLGWLEGRKAMTLQRLGVETTMTGSGYELWAGGADGLVRLFQDPHQTEGGRQSDWQWPCHGDPVSSTLVHPCGTVAATCSGQRSTPQVLDADHHYQDTQRMTLGQETEGLTRTTGDNSLKIWSLT